MPRSSTFCQTYSHRPKSTLVTAVVAAVFLSLAGCASKPTNPRGLKASQGGTLPARYQVQAGDTVSGIAARYGLNWRELSAHNNLDANHTIRIGQWLNFSGLTSTGSFAKQSYPNRSQSTPSPTRTQAQPVAQPAPVTAASPVQTVQQSVSTPTVSPTPNQSHSTSLIGSSAVMGFSYPVGRNNPVVRNFGTPINAGMTEGMFFSGRAGDAILASKAGTVVAANHSGRPMILIDHGNGYSSTYFDVQNISVRSGQNIRTGEQLGVMTAQTSSGAALFEFRISRNGRYIDPVSVLR
ncbi:MAG: M23 family metallopeptidase [Moraxella sp.]|nr:M23 family metallopeptidase [Moraxella sp.]